MIMFLANLGDGHEEGYGGIAGPRAGAVSGLWEVAELLLSCDGYRAAEQNCPSVRLNCRGAALQILSVSGLHASPQLQSESALAGKFDCSSQ
jgi:hypothetical protein